MFDIAKFLFLRVKDYQVERWRLPVAIADFSNANDGDGMPLPLQIEWRNGTFASQLRGFILSHSAIEVRI